MISSLTARKHLTLAALTAATVLVQGYHPLAEDGGIYVAGVKAVLDPTLFPHDRVFVSATEHYTMFAPLMAACVHTLHIPLSALLFAVYILGIWLLLLAGWRVAAALDLRSATATALLSAWMTLPIAGTSLLLMDPYVTGRTLSTPLCLLALSCVAGNTTRRSMAESVACLFLAGIFHPLMMMYGAALIVCVLAAKCTSRERIVWLSTLLAIALVVGAMLQHFGPVDTPAMAAAARSRYYWFLGRWQWYELLGLIGPLVVLGVAGWKHAPARSLCRGAIALGFIVIVVVVSFVREGAAVHAVARLQPLRAFLLLYAVMAVLSGGMLAKSFGNRAVWLFVLVMAATMSFVQRKTFPSSPHLEWPGRTVSNPWVEAFIWVQKNTPQDALFAIDSRYISAPDEDAQVFRAIAERSILPDFSKDGGQAAIHPVLADAWRNGWQAQDGLDSLEDADRSRRLTPLGVSWVVLQANAPTAWVCPYKNAAVKVCSLTAAAQR